MRKSREIRWKIDAKYTAETMPLDRLAEYLSHLAKMLGEPHHLHLLKMETASANAVLRMDGDAVERVRQRGREIRRGIAPSEAMESYRAVNVMLGEDNGKATLLDGTAEIIPFPGEIATLEALPVVVPTVHQQGHIDGELIKVGGERDWVPIQARPLGGTKITGCYAKKALAKKLGNHLYESVRLYGRGRWKRTERQWELDNFWIDEFDLLSAAPLPSVVAALRSVKTHWIKNPVANILRDEND
jgi:hypothetical protein